MRFWLPAIAILLIPTTVQAEDYRVVYSPSLALEVYIDNVASNAPQDWCRETLPLRIVSGTNKDSSVLASFLPRVGNLLQNQCNKLEDLPWQMTNATGSVLVTGTAAKEQSWRPIVITGATAYNAEPLDVSQLASTAPLQYFELPGGCHFRTWWDEKGQSLFIPDSKNLTCSAEGWLEGKNEITLTVNGKTQPIAVQFYAGFPLRNIHPARGELDIVAANNQRLVVSKKDVPNSWLLLRFTPDLHIWSFDGTLLVKMDKNQVSDPAVLKTQVDAVRKAWTSVVNQQIKINVLLIDDLHADFADPAIGAWRTVN